VGLRISRESILDVLKKDYIRTARSKGLPKRTVIYKHALRNALIPLTTILSLESAKIIMGGTVIVETVFSLPGIGLYAVESVLTMDFPAITGVTLLGALIFYFFTLTADIAYRIIDPRVGRGS
jgi:peptide/nickel transport system permease protein